jgi:hypothetical protein
LKHKYLELNRHAERLPSPLVNRSIDGTTSPILDKRKSIGDLW